MTIHRAVAPLLVLALALACATARAAPEAHILRVDPRASVEGGAPILTTVIELVQHKRMSDLTGQCAHLRGNAELDCLSERLERPKALYEPFKFPEANAIFTVTVDGADQPATHVSTERWGSSKDKPGVGTAWLLLIDASDTMGSRYADARQVAKAFIARMGKQDIVDVMFFNDRTVVKDSKWTSDKAKATAFVDSVSSTYPSQGRTKSLFNIIKQATVDSFSELGNVGTSIEVPLHQAMVLLSDGSSQLDPGSAAPTALGLRDYLTKGRFPEDNTTLPKTPLPIVSVWFPRRETEELFQNARQFMENLGNVEIGGAFFIVREGDAGKGARIAQAVGQRFDEMHIVKWRVPCVAPTISQTYKLVFKSTNPPIAGDTCSDCPTAIDPTTWPLDVDQEQTVASAKKDPIHPGGTVRVYGNFCWGSDHDRAELYLLPKNQPAPESLKGRSLDEARQFQRTLIEAGLRGKATTADSTFVEFELPDTDSFLVGKGKELSARLIIFDAKGKRTSAITADSILTLPAQKKPLNLLLIGGGTFGGVVLVLLVVSLFRGGGRRSRRRPSRAAPAPVPAPVPAPGPGMAPQGVMPAPGMPPPGMPAAGAPAMPGPAPMGPMGGHAPNVSLQGASGVYPIPLGRELTVGRDPSVADICLSEPRVSGTHARLKVEGGQLCIRDEGSNNGTYIHGSKIPSHVWQPVGPGTSVRFGPVEFTVRFE